MGDRFSKARIMYVCDYLKGGLIILATVLMLLFSEPRAHLTVLFVLGIAGNAVSGIFTPAANSLFPHILKEEQLQQANSYFTIKSSLEERMGDPHQRRTGHRPGHPGADCQIRPHRAKRAPCLRKK